MGSETGIQMYDLAKLIGSLMGKDIEVEEDPARVRPWEIWHLQSDNTKLYSIINTRPQMDFKLGLAKTIEDYRRHGWCYKK